MEKGKSIAMLAVAGATIWAMTRRAEGAPPALPGLANLYGKVKDASTGEVLPDVLITIDSMTAYTSGNGAYAFADLEIKTYTITLHKEGYETTSGDIALTEGGNEINIGLVLLEVPVFTCPHCGAEFATEAELNAHIAIAHPTEPPLPSPGTGVPTEAEVEAVKAVVRYRLDNLSFDVCASIHFTEEMNRAVEYAIAPLKPLEDRYVAEMDAIRASYQVYWDEMDARMKEYDWVNQKLWLIDANLIASRDPSICHVKPEVICYTEYIYGHWTCMPSNDPLSQHPLTTIYRYLTPTEVVLINEWEARWDSFGGGEANYSGGTYYSGAYYTLLVGERQEAIRHEYDLLMKEMEAKLKPLGRAVGMLGIPYWYCGYSLGY